MERRRPSLIGPLILITIGVLFLLGNLSILPLSFWEIVYRFWPLILILIGLEIIIGRRSIFGGLVILVLWFALIAGVLWLSFAQGGMFMSAPAITDQVNQPLGDIQSASVNLDLGLANVFVSALGAETADLMRGTFRHPEGMQIGKMFKVVGNEGQLTLREERFNFFVSGMSSTRWDVALNPNVPLALQINGGVGRADLDLRALNITMLNVDTGLGPVQINAPKSGSMTMRLNGGVGSLQVTVPQGVAVRIRVDKGIGSIRVDEARFPKSGNVYQSADFATAANKIDIQIDGGVGSIEIR